VPLTRREALKRGEAFLPSRVLGVPRPAGKCLKALDSFVGEAICAVPDALSLDPSPDRVLPFDVVARDTRMPLTVDIPLEDCVCLVPRRVGPIPGPPR
jgi:hypothetical protein